jgi:uncharacterized protein (TIGR03437 family)
VNTTSWQIVLSLAAAAAPVFATSNGEPIKRTGAVVDGSLTCTQCHNQFAPPVNQGPGRVLVSVNAYTPGVKQSLTVQVIDNTALRWGFQLTARVASDETRQAGSFTANDSIRVQCDPAGDAPCNGALEFATHRPESTGGGVRGQRTFVVEWTAPGRDVGQVIFRAAALAADGDGLESGSRTYTTSTNVGAAGCHFITKPAIMTNGVTNGASFQPGISPNSLITIFGGQFANIGDKYQALRSDLAGGQLPPDLACAAVEIGGKRAPIFYTQIDQINLQAPNLPAGSTTAIVVLNPGAPNELRSDPASVLVQALSPALFTFTGTTSVKGRNASNGNQVLADPADVPGGVFARPGDIVTLYGTGFGFTNPVYQPGEFALGPAFLQQPVTVTIGANTLANEDVLYAGLSPDAPGLYQFNLRVPLSTPDGAAPVSIRIGAVQTQTGVTIPVKR